MDVLLASRQQDDRRDLEVILRGSPWKLIAAGGRAEAEGILQQLDVPIVLCDRDLSGEPWQNTVRALVASRSGACVILVSNVTDQYLWDEVVKRGGFDVLTRPFESQAVLSMLNFAHTHCQTSWPMAPRGRVGT